MTNPIALDLLKLAEHYLSALHGSVARHDNIGLNLSCGGCALRDEIRDVLPKLAAAVSVPPPATRADDLTGAERQFLTFALDLAFDRMVSDDGFTDEDEAALAKLRRLADETQQPEPSPAAHDASGVVVEAGDNQAETLPKRPPMDAWRLLGIDACPNPLTHNVGCGCPTDQTPAVVAQPVEEPS